MVQNNHSLWQEKYRPTTVKFIILPPKVKKFVDNIIETGVLPNLLLYYPKPGNGKTSLARSICNDLGLGAANVFHINASLSANIDMLRTDITDFASVWTIDNKVKVVILEEMENASLAFQNALKDFSETYSQNCRFIMTTNNISKIIEPLRSRFELIDFNFEDKKVVADMIPKIVNRLSKMLDHEKVEYKEETIEKLVKKTYPDVRWMIKTLQCEFIENGKITERVINLTSIDKDFYDMIINKRLSDARKYMVEKQLPYGEMYTKLFHEFLPLIENKTKQANAIILIAEYMDKHTRSIDQEITFAACLIQLMQIM